MGTDRYNIVFYNDGGQKLLVCFVTYQKITHVVGKDICRMLNDNNIEWGIFTDGNILGYVITTYHKGTYCIPNAGTINTIFAKLKNSKKEYEVFTPQYIRSSLPEALLREGFALEEICYLMNIKVSNISNYISKKSILEIGKQRMDIRLTDGSIAKHPLVAVLDEYISHDEGKSTIKK